MLSRQEFKCALQAEALGAAHATPTQTLAYVCTAAVCIRTAHRLVVRLCVYARIRTPPRLVRKGKGVPADAPGGPGLSSKEIKALMLRVDENADGVISYEEFAPLCYELLLQVR